MSQGDLMIEKSDIENPLILLMSRGWDHDGWENEFYPDDLPQDWRLSYYANEFHGVVVPETDWLEINDCEEWVENVHEEFRFYLELTTDQGIKSGRLKQIVEFLGMRFAGLVVDNPDGLHSALTAAGLHQLPVILPFGSCEGITIDGLWVDNPDDLVADEKANSYFLDGKTSQSLADMRRLADLLYQRSKPGSPSLMVFAGEVPDVRMMQDCRIMLNLMGIT